jgi:uncharacterized protein YjbI with pentapeptide repeats
MRSCSVAALSMTPDPMAKTSYRRWAFPASVCLLSLALGSSPALGAAKVAKKPQSQQVSLLFALTAGSGNLIPKKGSGARYKLVLKSLDHDVTWFSDRPARKSGSFPLLGLAGAWKRFGFVADPPNAALTYTDPDGNTGRTVIVELSHPRYSAARLSFAVRVLDPATVEEPNLVDHARSADREPARRLTDASLFVDSTTAEAGCATAVVGECQNMDLGAVNLSSTDLQYANYSHSNLDGSDISNTVIANGSFVDSSLRNVNFEGSGLEYANLDQADLTGADLESVELNEARLEDADLTRANLKGAKMNDTLVSLANFSGADLEGIAPHANNGDQWEYVNFSGANLRHADLEWLPLLGADFEGADLTGATIPPNDPSNNFCNAKMPDGTIGPCNGPVSSVP